MADPVPLFLHEVVDIVGRGGRPYMEHTVGFDADGTTSGGLELLGTWEVVGTTGRWPQVVNVWEIDGWDGWARLGQRTNVDKAANAELAAGGTRPTSAAPAASTACSGGPPAARPRPSWSRRAPRGPGSCTSCRRCGPARDPTTWPRRSSNGRRPWPSEGSRSSGCTTASSPTPRCARSGPRTSPSHTALLRDGDPWPTTARAWCTRWREELMTPGPGSPLAPAEAPR